MGHFCVFSITPDIRYEVMYEVVTLLKYVDSEPYVWRHKHKEKAGTGFYMV